MASPTAEAARAVLRKAERPLTMKELTPLVLERVPLTAKKPEHSIRSALQADPACVSDGDGHWVYLPTFVRGAAMRSPVRMASPETGELAIAGELVALLWPLVEAGRTTRAARLKLEEGPTVRMGWSRKNGTRTGLTSSIAPIVTLPDPFWSWWGKQQAKGANTLVVRCEDGETGRYGCRAVAMPSPTAAAAAEAHRPLQEAAEQAVRRTPGGIWLTDLAGRLLARGLYHRDDPTDLPPSFLPGLMVPLGRFVLGPHGVIEPRPDITPAIARLLAARLIVYWLLDEERSREAMALPAPTPPALAPPPELAEVEPPPVEGLRFKVMLTWRPDVWRRIELRDDQTLEDLHDAIQDAFGWDDAHLYAFFLTASPWDPLTEVARPTGPMDLQPTADEVYLGDLALDPGRHLLYVFDFGDDLRHLVTFEGSFSLEGDGGGEGDEGGRGFPRVVGGEGEAPDQYAVDDEAAEDEEDEGDEGDVDVYAGDDLADFIDEGMALGLIPVQLPPGFFPPLPSGFADPGALASAIPPDLLGLGSFAVPTLTRFALPRPGRKLRRLPINLDQLGAAFVEKSEALEFRLDLEAGTLLWLYGDEGDPVEHELRARIAADPLRYAKVPVEGDAELRRDATDFLATVEDEELRERLAAAVASTRPRRRVFDALARDPEEQARWIDFSDRRLAERILDWLASRGVAPDLPRRG